MPPTHNPQDNYNLSDYIIKYGNLKYYNGFTLGFVVGSATTIIIFGMKFQNIL
jgi:hypothetical protein